MKMGLNIKTILWLFVAEAVFFITFAGNDGRNFHGILLIFFTAELSLLAPIARRFTTIRQLHPELMRETRLRYLPTAIGMLGFACFSLRLTPPNLILPVGLTSAALSLLGKWLTLRNFMRIGVLF